MNGHLCDRRELVDEPAGRFHYQGRPDRVGQYLAGVLQPRRAAYEMPHDPGRLHGRRVHRRRVYAAGILRGRRDRYHYTGFAIPFLLAAVLTPV